VFVLSESAREKELAERRRRLGLPEPKKAVSLAGPRQGKPPAPDEGDDGNGGWVTAYEEILRAAMRDLRVYNTARRLHGGGTQRWVGPRRHRALPKGTFFLSMVACVCVWRRCGCCLCAGEGWDGLNRPDATLQGAASAAAGGAPPPQPEGSAYATITVYRDAKRIFLSAYDASTSFLRFVATDNDTSAINELLAPNSIEARNPRPKPADAKEVWVRLTELLRFDRDRCVADPAPACALHGEDLRCGPALVGAAYACARGVTQSACLKPWFAVLCVLRVLCVRCVCAEPRGARC
jgi:hypothetical protein